MEGFNNYDYFVVSFLLITTAFGFIRGFSGEFCSFLKIIIASAISAYSIVIVSDMFFQNKSGIVSSVVLSIVPGVVFFLSNVILGIFLFPVREFIRVLLPFVLDRILGVVVAFVKNIFIIILIHTILIVGVPMVSGKSLKWAEKAKVAKFLNPATESVVESGLIQGYIKGKVGKKKGAQKDSNAGIAEGVKEKYESFFGDESKDVDNSTNTGESTTDNANSLKKNVDMLNKVKDLYDSLGDADTPSDAVEPVVSNTNALKKDTDILSKIKNLYNSFGEADDVSKAGDVAKDQVPNLDVDELKDLIDNLNN